MIFQTSFRTNIISCLIETSRSFKLFSSKICLPLMSFGPPVSGFLTHLDGRWWLAPGPMDAAPRGWFGNSFQNQTDFARSFLSQSFSISFGHSYAITPAIWFKQDLFFEVSRRLMTKYDITSPASYGELHGNQALSGIRLQNIIGSSGQRGSSLTFTICLEVLII